MATSTQPITTPVTKSTSSNLDLVSVIMSDHKTVDNLFNNFWSIKKAEEQQQIVYQIIRELSIHDGIEDTILYPLVKKTLDHGPEMVTKSLEAHQKVRELLAKIDEMKVGDKGFESQMTILQKEVTDHVKYEESFILPELQKKLTKEKLMDYGQEVMNSKSKMPTRPHPMAPQSSTLLKAAAVVQAPIDKMKDKSRFEQSESTH